MLVLSTVMNFACSVAGCAGFGLQAPKIVAEAAIALIANALIFDVLILYYLFFVSFGDTLCEYKKLFPIFW